MWYLIVWIPDLYTFNHYKIHTNIWPKKKRIIKFFRNCLSLHRPFNWPLERFVYYSPNTVNTFTSLVFITAKNFNLLFQFQNVHYTCICTFYYTVCRAWDLQKCYTTNSKEKQQTANELEKKQHESAPIVSGATKLVSIEKLLKEVGWDTLSCRRKNINKFYSTKW